MPPGTTEYIAYPFIKKAFEERGLPEEPLLAHSFERVMPGKNYVASIRNFWRVCSGINAEARERVVRFLSEVIEVEKFPLTVLDRPMESETCKIVENSFRATMLAFMHEWSLFAERNGVDLIKVIEAIKVRPTHSNILFPGPGIGGYCLPKDGGLGIWSYKHLMGFEDDIFKITPLAININDTRALHAAQLVRDALRNRNRIVASSLIAVFWGFPTGRMWAIPATAVRKSWSENWARWAPRCGSMIPMWSIGGKWKNRMTIRPITAGRGFSAIRKDWRICRSPRTS